MEGRGIISFYTEDGQQNSVVDLASSEIDTNSQDEAENSSSPSKEYVLVTKISSISENPDETIYTPFYTSETVGR